MFTYNRQISSVFNTANKSALAFFFLKPPTEKETQYASTVAFQPLSQCSQPQALLFSKEEMMGVEGF